VAQTRTITQGKLRRIAALDVFLRPLLLAAPKPPPARAGAPERILVLELWGIGDLIIATPLLAELRERFPGARVSVLAKPHAHEILAESGLADEVIGFDFPWTRFTGKYRLARWNLAAMDALFRGLRARRFDLCLDARRDLRSNVVAYLSGAARRIGYDFGGGTHLLTDVVPSGDQQAHKIDDWMRLLEPVLGFVPEARTPRLHVTAAERRAAAVRLRGEGPGSRPVVLIHPGASHAVRRVREEIVSDVAGRLNAEAGVDTVLVVDPDGYGSSFALPPGVSVVQPSLRELMALVAEADALVSADSAAMHMAIALGTPATAVFGSARPDWYGPRNSVHRIIVEDVPCRPCFDACIYSSPLCMDRIGGDSVFAAVSSQLAARAVQRSRELAPSG
jgi:ADP-heptose:LPS heptosyltransferase